MFKCEKLVQLKVSSKWTTQHKKLFLGIEVCKRKKLPPEVAIFANSSTNSIEVNRTTKSQYLINSVNEKRLLNNVSKL